MPSESHAALLERCLSAGWDALYGEAPAAAAEPLRAALSIAPECGEAWAGLAEIFPAAAQAVLLGRAVTLAPDEWRWRLAWADALLTASAVDAALAVYESAAAARPDAAAARLGRGRALARLGRPLAAIADYREALALGGDDPAALRELAILYIESDDPLAAAEALTPITGAHRPDAPALAVLARAWAALGETAKARAALARAEELDPALDAALCAAGLADVAALRATLAADDPASPPPPPTMAYVRALFDRYADRFDAELVARLEYRGPQLLAAAVAQALPGATGLRVLDLGCGTGLAGEVLRPLAAALHGVDLSAAMVAQAEKRRLYDGLTVGGLVEALRAAPAAWDLLTAADVLMYVGDLTETFAAAAAALRPGGAFAFTVEAMDATESAAAGDAGLFLRESRRYAHGADYLRTGLTAVGLELRLLETVVLRRDRRQPVYGYCVVALKKG